MAWAGPFICFALAFFLWIFSADSRPIASSRLRASKTTEHSNDIQSQEGYIHEQSFNKNSKTKLNAEASNFTLPTGKLVSLKGFNQYFSSPEWVEMKDTDIQRKEDMEDLGQDFPSYFGTGRSINSKRSGELSVLNGLGVYIENVDNEEKLENVKDSQTSFESSKKWSSNEDQFTSVFSSEEDQLEFLAQFKSTQEQLAMDDADLIKILRERSRTRDNAGPLTQLQDQTTTNNETKLELKPEVEQNMEQETEVEPELETAATTELISEFRQESEIANHYDHHTATSTPIIAGQVAHLVDQMQMQVQLIDKDKGMNNVKKIMHWTLPDFNLLDPSPQHMVIQDTETQQLLEKVLLDFGVKAKVIRVARGPVITRYELAPAPGVKISKIVNLADDIALGLAARDVRVEAPIPGKAAIGIEVPNKHPRAVPFREVLETNAFSQYSSKLKVALGMDIANQPIIADLTKMPHLLVAGATGSGKSVCITTIINSILYNATPAEVKFLLVDPKMVELNQYNGIPHLLAPVVVDPKKAASALKWIVKEMENRYELFAAEGVRDIERYNKLKAAEMMSNIPALPFMVVIIDELADLMMVAAGEVEEAICRLAQMARAAGIHIVIATQRPSVDVITGVIKANIPSRISFAVSSQIDSRTILDATGAEKLLGRGDMLYSPLGVNKALRIQGCLVTDDEVQRVITHWKSMGKPEYLDPERLFAETTLKKEEGNGSDDALFIDAGQLLIKTGMASVSFLQRRLKLGYARAARLMDMLEEEGIVGAYEGSKPRQILITLEEFMERFG